MPAYVGPARAGLRAQRGDFPRSITTCFSELTARIAAVGPIGRAAEFGSIEPGKFADLVVLNADPRQDIRRTRDIALVMKNGRLYDAATLDEVWPRPRPLEARWFATEQPPMLGRMPECRERREAQDRPAAK